jgi:hypothetical protein
MNNLFCIGWLTLILYVFLETDAIPKWGKLLRLKFLKYEEYEKQNGIFGNISYKHFLLSKYQNFFIYLFTCQECLGIWLTIGAYAGWHHLLYGWATFGLTAIGVVVGIATLKYILRKLYE